MKKPIYQYKIIFPIAFLFSMGSLIIALGFEFIGGLYPCPLCIQQRYIHLAIMLLCALMFLNQSYVKRPRLVAFFIFLGFLASSILAFYHMGIEYKWWLGDPSCTGGAVEVSGDILQSLENGATGPRCDEIPWSLFGISMAGYNAIFSFMLCCFALFESTQKSKVMSSKSK